MGASCWAQTPTACAGLQELKRASVFRLLPARGPVRATGTFACRPGGSADPRGTNANSSRPSCPASYLGNQTQSPDVTGPLRGNLAKNSTTALPASAVRQPSPWRRRDWRQGAARPPPALLAPRPPGRALRSSLRRKGTSPSGKWRLLASGRLARAPWWPKYVQPPTGISFPREAFVHRHPCPCPLFRSPAWVPALETRTRRRQHETFLPTPLPRTSQQCLATCLVGGNPGPCSRHSAPILGSLLHLPWCLP